jgi:hypothetical protein
MPTTMSTTIIKLLLGLAFIMLLMGCQSSQESEKARVDKAISRSQKVLTETEQSLPKLEILDQTNGYEDGNHYIMGTARARVSVGYAQLTFGVMDSEGNRIDTASTSISNLKAGDTWKFKALLLQPEKAASVTRPIISAQ